MVLQILILEQVNAGMQIRDIGNNTFSQFFQSGNTIILNNWTANGRILLKSTNASQV